MGEKATREDPLSLKRIIGEEEKKMNASLSPIMATAGFPRKIKIENSS